MLFKLLDMLDAVGQERERLDALFSDESARLVSIHERARRAFSGLQRRRNSPALTGGVHLWHCHVSPPRQRAKPAKFVQYHPN